MLYRPVMPAKNITVKLPYADSEIITSLVVFHGGQFRNFRHFHLGYVCVHLRDCFSNVVSYNRFIELSHRSAVLFIMFLHYCCRGECTGISFIDSTVLGICHKPFVKKKWSNKAWINCSIKSAKIDCCLNRTLVMIIEKVFCNLKVR